MIDLVIRAMLDKSYAWLDAWMSGREFAANGAFSFADCSAAPALFYAHWGYPIPPASEALLAHRARLLARPSIARVVFCCFGAESRAHHEAALAHALAKRG